MESITSNIVSLHGAASSLIGGRSENQDDMGWIDTPLGFLLVLCDGMGGGPGGKTASYIAKYVVMNTLMSCSSQADRADALKMAVSRANDALFQKMDEVPSLRGMGSTLVAILINSESAVIAHLGDSRAYRMRGRQVLFRTQDHSLVGELVKNKAMTEEQARNSPQSNVITRGLGNTSNHVAEIDVVPYRKGDRFILCTDGVWGIMPHQDLMERFGVPVDSGQMINNLQAEIDRLGNAGGGHHDNHTLAILEMNTDSILKDKMSNQIKIILAALSVVLFASLITNVFMGAKIRELPSREKFEQLQADVERLSDRNALIQNLQDGDLKQLYIQLETIKQENGQLKAENDALRKANDSLQNLVVVAAKERTHQKGAAKKPTARKTEQASPQEVVDEILRQFDEMEKAKSKNSTKEVVRLLTERRDNIEQLLKQISQEGLSPDPKAIIRILPNKDVISQRIGNKDKDGYYRPTKVFITHELNKSKQKVLELEKNLNK